MKNKKLTKKINLLTFTGFLLISFVFSYKLLLTKGLPGLRDDWLMVPFSSQHQYSMTRFLYSWFGGGAFYRNLGEIPGIVLGIFSFIFKFNGEFYSKFLILFLPALAGFTFYQLSIALKLKYWPAVLSGFVYISSPFFYNSVVSGYLLFLIAFALLPVAIKLYIQILEAKKIDIKQIIYLSIIIRLVIIQDNVVYIAGIIIISYFFFHLLTNYKKEIRMASLKSLLIALFLIIFSAQFLVLIPLNLEESLMFVASGLDTWITDLSPKIIPAIYQGGGGYHYFLASMPSSISVFWRMASSIFIALLTGSLLFVKKNKYTLYFSFLFILGTLGFKGANPPFGMINRFLYQRLPIFMGGFRNSQYFTTISIIGQSFCFSAFVNYGYQQLKRQNKYISIILLILIIMIRALPFFTDNYGHNVQNIPLNQDLFKLDTALRNREDDNTVLFLPPIVPITYKNSKFAGLDFMVYGQPHKFIGIAGDSPFQRQLIEHLYLSDNSNLFRWFFSIYNVQHIVWRNDFQSETISFMTPDYIKYRPIWNNQRLYNNIITLPEVSLDEKFSLQTALYWYSKPSPIIYSPTKITLIKNDPLKPLSYQNLVPQDPLSATIFSQQNDHNIVQKISSLKLNGLTKLKFTKVNPTKYQINIKNDQQPFILIFSENYNKLWQVTSKHNKQIENLPHFKINGYANAWLIDPDTICQQITCKTNNDQLDFDLTVSFLAQKYYFPAMILAYGTFFIAILYLLVYKLIAKNNR